jgi:SAM-dependent methyltransferase
MTSPPDDPRPAGLEDALHRAVSDYVNQDYPGARRTAEYNAKRVEARMIEEDSAPHLGFVQRVKALVPPPARVLEIGSGSGGQCVALARAGYDVTGVEPNDDGVRASRLRVQRYPGILCRFEKGVAEALPLPDASMDLVLSRQVLEHVPDLPAGVRECFRVLAPGGLAYHNMPNYCFPYEPHYKLPFPPRASRRVGRLYLRAIGRDTRLFDEQIFPTMPAPVLALFREVGFVDVEETYAAEVAAKITSGEVNTPSLQPVVRLLKKTGLLRLLGSALLAMELYPTLLITARKPAARSA